MIHRFVGQLAGIRLVGMWSVGIRLTGIRLVGIRWLKLLKLPKLDDRGSTTIMSALFTTAIVVLSMAALLAATNLVQQRRASVAADLTAVAGAIAAQRGYSACESAQRIAQENDAVLSSCEKEGEDVEVVVVKQERTATARAGPAE